MITEQKKHRSTWTIHIDRELFERVRQLADSEGRTIRGQFERLLVAAIDGGQTLETRGDK